MKKSILVLTGLFVAMLFAVNSVQAQNTQTFNLSATVEKYIEVNPSYTNLGPGDYHQAISLTPGEGDHVPDGVHPLMNRWQDAVYANCPFNISYAGSNDAQDGLPILAREEVSGNGFDRLQTQIQTRVRINGTQATQGTMPGYERHDMNFTSDADGAASGTWSGKTVDFVNAPHDGEVEFTLTMNAFLPHKSPDFGNDNTWNESADAGEYTATLVATYSTL